MTRTKKQSSSIEGWLACVSKPSLNTVKVRTMPTISIENDVTQLVRLVVDLKGDCVTAGLLCLYCPLRHEVCDKNKNDQNDKKVRIKLALDQLCFILGDEKAKLTLTEALI